LIVIAGAAEFDNPADRDACIAGGAPLVQATRDEESGCLEYVFAADPPDPRRIVIYELWEDATTLDAHFLHPNYFGMREVFNPYREAGSYTIRVMKYRIDAVDQVYGEDRVASSRFWSVE
jgi:quinol monooxygenase YgiN